jgi:hypothetical protein
MSAVSFIRRFIHSLPEGETFTTRDCLGYGHRSAVDHALSRLVKQRWIRRLARGVFARDPDYQNTYSDFEIAKLKGEAFGHQITQHPCTTAQELGLTHTEDTIENKRNTMSHRPNTSEGLVKPLAKSESVFATSGRTTKFRAGNKVIHLKQVAERKMKLMQSKVGRAMAAVWHLGKLFATPQAREAAARNFNRIDRAERQRHMRWLPAWLINAYGFTRRWEAVHTL